MTAYGSCRKVELAWEGLPATFSCAELMYGVHWDSHQKETLPVASRQKSKTKVCRATSGKAESFWKAGPWTDEAEIEPFVHNQQRYVWKEKNAAFAERTP